MIDKINGRTQEEIKKGLETCAAVQGCRNCPYSGTRCVIEVSNDALAYIRQLEAAQPRWISVEERLPAVENENGTLQCTETVLAVDKNGYLYTGFFRIYKYDKSIEFVGCDHASLDVDEFDVTHWMPLPKPPKEEAT